MIALGEVPTLATPRLSLRRPVLGDAESIAGQANDREVATWMSRLPHPYGTADAVHFVEHIASREADWVIAKRDGGELLGVVGLAPHADRVEFGYWLGREHWNRGIATEAGRAVLSYAFGASALTRVLSGCFEGNGRSSRVLEKLGFTITGRSSRPCLAREQDVPHVEMALTREAWSALAAAGEAQ